MERKEVGEADFQGLFVERDSDADIDGLIILESCREGGGRCFQPGTKALGKGGKVGRLSEAALPVLILLEKSGSPLFARGLLRCATISFSFSFLVSSSQCWRH